MAKVKSSFSIMALVMLVLAVLITSTLSDQPIGQLKETLGQNVISSQRWTRPLEMPGGDFLYNINPNLFSHSGNVLNTADGQKLLSHKTDGTFGWGGNTVVTSADHMSGKWKVCSWIPVSTDKWLRFASFLASRGSDLHRNWKDWAHGFRSH